ncbi:MAG: TIM barrel protein, partial [Verrucomicrobia bacterium]|nr:TIM barrel protein [Verrucomicrobiota bacterium]
MLKFDANLSWLFQEESFLERFGAAAHSGFKGVEILFPYSQPAKEIRAALQCYQLEQVLINAPAGDFEKGDRGLAAIPGRQPEFRESFEQAVEYAAELACTRIHVMSGIAGDTPAARTAYLDNLEHALSRCESLDLTILIEPINTRDFPGYYLTTPEHALELLREIGRPNLKIQLDWYHAQIMGGDLSTRTSSLFADIGHFQLASVPSRGEPDKGEVRYSYLFSLIDKLGYTGWIGCEY